MYNLYKKCLPNWLEKEETIDFVWKGIQRNRGVFATDITGAARSRYSYPSSNTAKLSEVIVY